jgi:N-acetylmuramoyl-L-alanine amidase
MKRLQNVFLILTVFLISHQLVHGQSAFNDHSVLKKVVIDAGHGGRDPGASGANSVEKDIILPVALMAGEFLNGLNPDIEVLFTRTNDTFVPLHARADFANRNAADLFISIHCNSNPEPRLRGAETYVMGLHKTEDNLEVAKTENAAILAEENYLEQYGGFDPDSDEDYIMLSMMQVATIGQSIDFSAMVQERLYSTGGMKNRGVKQAGFVVLYLTTMPGALVEIGYLSNEEDEKYLLQKDNQRKIALAIAQAIDDYKRKNDTKVFAYAAEPEEISNKLKEEAASVFRLWFATFGRELPMDHRRFRGLENVWYFHDNNGYNYTCGEAGSLGKIKEKLIRWRESDNIRKRYLRDVKIIETQNDRIISVVEPESL